MQQLRPSAPDVVRLASWGQHIERWTIPRDTYPLGRPGYKQWRGALAAVHERRCAEILTEVGFEEEVATRVGELITKKRVRIDPDAALLQDAVCLTFIELELTAFSTGRDPKQLISIFAKVWAKMTAQGHAAAKGLIADLPAEVAGMVHRAVDVT